MEEFVERKLNETSEIKGQHKIWKGVVNNSQAPGRIKFNRISRFARVWVYMLKHNLKEPQKNRQIISTCEEKLCIAPDHCIAILHNLKHSLQNDLFTLMSAEERAFRIHQLYADTDSHPNGCKFWKKTKSIQGYGRSKIFGEEISAHRKSWSLFHRKSVPKNLIILHSCDNTLCVESSHLRLGTPSENSQDQVDRSRTLKGENHKKAKISESQALEIIKSKGEGTASERAKRFGVPKTLINHIMQRRIAIMFFCVSISEYSWFRF